METEEEKLKRDADIAMFRFGLIAPTLNKTLDKSATSYFKEIARKPVTPPGGTERLYSCKTYEKWREAWLADGLEGLMPKTRSDKGTTRVLSGDAKSRIKSLRDEYPCMSAVMMHKTLGEENLIDSSVSVRTVQRFVLLNDLKRGSETGEMKDRKAFEAPCFGDLWQADTCYLPQFKDAKSKKLKQTYAVALIDDHSRLHPYGDVFKHDNALAFQNVLYNSIKQYGIPVALYVDNGAPYVDTQLKMICVELGIKLIHTPVRDGAAKAKIERSWRTKNTRWLDGVNIEKDIHCTEDYKKMYSKYIVKYNNTAHTGIEKQTPFECYKASRKSTRPIKSEEWLKECFQHRVFRVVRNDHTVTIDNVSYDVPLEAAAKVRKAGGRRERVEIRYTPEDMSTAYIRMGEKHYPIVKTDKNKNFATSRKNASGSSDRSTGSRGRKPKDQNTVSADETAAVTAAETAAETSGRKPAASAYRDVDYSKML